MAVSFTGTYNITQQGATTILTLSFTRTGGPASGDGISVPPAEMAAIESALASAGGRALADGEPVAGPAMLKSDGTGYVAGSAVWDKPSGGVELRFPIGFSVGSSFTATCRFVLRS
ncbi:MAG: hypothetical protein OHK0011_19480 [Turneriella sp.]